MKTIGLIGGMSWESSAEYYRMINEQVRDRLGSTHSAQSIMLSVDFAEIEALQHQGQWDKLAEKMCHAARQL
ncbi:aspartate/glutamate racemase family protein [Snodgrassella alvi]